MEVYQTELRDMLDAARREPAKRARDRRGEAPQERPAQRPRVQEPYDVIDLTD